jgi:phosphatidate cytidylyltransferase
MDTPAARKPKAAVSSFWSRILVALVGLPVVLGLLWLGGWWLFFLVAAGGLVALHEFYVMTRPLRPIVIAGYAGLIAILLGIELGGLEWGTGGILVALALSFLLKGVADTRQSATVSVGTTILGVTWIGFGLGFVMLLRDIPEYGRLASFTVLLTVFAADTAAYYLGRLLGRHKLAPKVSPGKTWEGFFAGALVAVAVAFFALYKDREEFLTIGESIVLGLAIALVGPLGDLFESLLKRDMSVKDSGRLLAAHGGVLDRVDALLFSSVAAYYVIAAFEKAH